MKRWIIVVCSLLVICGIGAGLYVKSHNASPIPPKISSQITFPIFYPTSSSGGEVDRSTIKYDRSQGVLSYIYVQGSVKSTIAEQSTPDAFIDVPAAYDKLIDTLNGYASFDTPQGKVDLTRPKEFNGQQSAAMNTKGTLMFVHLTNGTLTENQWKTFFSNLEIVK